MSDSHYEMLKSRVEAKIGRSMEELIAEYEARNPKTPLEFQDQFANKGFITFLDYISMKNP